TKSSVSSIQAASIWETTPVFLLVRSLQASSRYTNNNVYQLGDIRVAGNGDRFRRLLLESTVVLRNPMVMAGGG
ncbi:PilW family protein, partial [Aeromonas veronii]|uniref:PilW family protein n=1 Tax=Aeromonas veronii TaxID=654 RepID=UPI002248034F